MKRWLLVILVALIYAGGAKAEELYFIDAHSQVDHLTDLDSIVPLMDKAGVARSNNCRRMWLIWWPTAMPNGFGTCRPNPAAAGKRQQYREG